MRRTGRGKQLVRVIAVWEILGRGEAVTARQLAEATGARPRTIRRDLELLIEAGALIVSSGVGAKLRYRCASRVLEPGATSQPAPEPMRQPRKVGLTRRQEDRAVRLYCVEGLSADVVAARMGVGAASVRAGLKRRGVHRTASQSARLRAERMPGLLESAQSRAHGAMRRKRRRICGCGFATAWRMAWREHRKACPSS